MPSWKFETVDTYYRRCNSADFVGKVMVPLLCISALDDPLCTKEAIPWDECRANKNVILATTIHGGHLAYFEGKAARSLWWVRAVHEFCSVLYSSPLIHKKYEMQPDLPAHPVPSIDQGPYINIVEGGMITAMCNEATADFVDLQNEHVIQTEEDGDLASDTEESDDVNAAAKKMTTEPAKSSREDLDNIVLPVKKCIDQLSRRSSKSIWLLAYIAFVTTWPVLGMALQFFFKKKFRNLFPVISRRR